MKAIHLINTEMWQSIGKQANNRL